MPRIRAVEGFVTEREVGNDVAFDRGFQEWPLEPRGVAHVATPDIAIAVEPQPDQHIAAKGFGNTEALGNNAFGRDRCARCAAGQTVDNLFDQRKALLDLADTYPDPGVDIAGIEHRHLEGECVVGRVSQIAAGIETAARSAA